MTVLRQLNEGSWKLFLSENGGNEADAFAAVAMPCLERLLVQLRAPLPSFHRRDILREIWIACLSVGRPLPPNPDEPQEHLDLSARLGDAMEQAMEKAAVPTRLLKRPQQFVVFSQFMRALCHPEVRNCTLSFRKLDANGKCERQNLGVCNSRLSGSHFEECPLFLTLTPDNHLKTLQRAWNEAELENIGRFQDVFLPEDFRDLRCFLHLHARHGSASPSIVSQTIPEKRFAKPLDEVL